MSKSLEMENKFIDNTEHCLLLSVRTFTICTSLWPRVRPSKIMEKNVNLK